MKFNIILVLLVFSANIIASDHVRIAFEVKNCANNSIDIKIFENYITREKKIFKCKLDSTGNGNVSFYLDRPREAFFFAGRTNIFMFLTPGDHLKVDLDFENPVQTINFKGVGADHCNFIKEMRLRFSDGDLGRKLIKNGYSNNEYKKEINKRWQERKDYFNQYNQEHKLSKAFKYHAQSLVDYSSIREHLMLFEYKKKEGRPIKSPKEFYSFICPKYFNNDSVLKYSQDYGSTISFYWPIVKDTIKLNSTLSKQYQIFNACYKGETKNWITGFYLQSRYKDYPLFDKDYENFKQNCNNQEVLSILFNTFEKFRKPIPKKVDNDIVVAYNGRKTTLGSLLSERKGKLLYIDIWSSYCAPCQSEMPYLLRLKKALKGFPFEVISISVDTSVDAWKNAIKKMNLPQENQFIIKGSFNSELCKEYAISGIPRYLIIDSESRLYTAKAKSPSNNTLEKELIEIINFAKVLK